MENTEKKLNLIIKTINGLRIVPRLLIGLYGYVFYEVAQWYMSLPEPTNPQASFVAIIVGAAAAWFGLYVNSGKNDR